MNNNRCGPNGGRGDPPWMYGSRGDPPIVHGARGHPPWKYASRGDPPIRSGSGIGPPEYKCNPVSSIIHELILKELGCKNSSYGRGMPKNEQPPSRSPKGESFSHREKGLAGNEAISYLKYIITNDVDRSILTSSLCGEGWGGALN